MPKTAKEHEPNFEKDMEALEAIVSALEEGGLSLDDSLKRFEEGSRLVRQCEKALQEAEKRIEILTKNVAGELEAQPFEESGASDAAPKRAVRPKPEAMPIDDTIPEPEEVFESGEELLF